MALTTSKVAILELALINYENSKSIRKQQRIISLLPWLNASQ